MKSRRFALGLGLGSIVLAVGAFTQKAEPARSESPRIQGATAPEQDKREGSEGSAPRQAQSTPPSRPRSAGDGSKPVVAAFSPQQDEENPDHQHTAEAKEAGIDRRAALWRTYDGGPAASGGDAPGGSPRWSCKGDRAYVASAPLVFSSPTRQPLAAALNEVSASSKGRQIALVLHHRGDERLATLSATQPGASGKEMFLPGQAPTPAPLVPAFGQPPGVTSDEPQGAALVRFADRRGTVTVQLRRLVWRATLGASCDDVQVDVHALLPISQLGLTLHLAGGDKTIAELLGVALADGDADEAPSGPALPGASISRPQPEALHFAFKAAPAAFDHGSH